MERSGTAGTPPTQDANPAVQPASADGARPAAQQESQGSGSADSQDSQADGRRGRSRRDQATSAPPWRVEGMPDDKQGRPVGRPN